MSFRRILAIVVASTTALGVLPSAAFARDELEAIVRKDKLTATDRATIETVVNQRIKKLNDASDTPKALREAKQALIETVKVTKPSEQGLEAYASACAAGLATPVTSDKLYLGLAAVQILVEMNQSQTANALASALVSPHTAVRFRAARGLQDLQKQIATDRLLSRSTLAALGRAGATEEDENVRRAIYDAIDFSKAVTGFQGGDDSASALSSVFAARLDRIEHGSRDEWKDVEGFEAAARCFKLANDSRKKDLVRSLAGFLDDIVDHYCAADTAPELTPTLVTAAKVIEQSLVQMLKTANIDAPGSKVSSKLSEKRGDSACKAAKDALSAWNAAIDKSPWPLQ